SKPSVGDSPFTTLTSVKARQLFDPRPQQTHYPLPKNGETLGSQTPTMPETQSHPMSPSNAPRDFHPRTSDPAAQKKFREDERTTTILQQTFMIRLYHSLPRYQIQPPRARSTTTETQSWAQFP
ncbi:hypothetical protein CCUS01_11450, partial [Colletotrichum cuscutae]